MTSTQNLYAAPKSNVDPDPAVADIDSLPVSDAWKQKFKAMHKAGKAVSMFNVLAFLFGPFYYACKGMWKKALTLFVLTAAGILLLDAALEFMGLGAFARATGFAAAAVYAALANRDYYSKMVLGQNGWWWPKKLANQNK